MRTVTALLSILLFGGAHAIAQNIQTSTIEWQSFSTFDVDTGSDVIESTKIVSSANDITWYDTNNNVRKTIAINSNTGTWTNVTTNGAITFNVTCENSSGIAQFWKTDNETRVRFSLVGPEGAEIYELSVTNVAIQQ